MYPILFDIFGIAVSSWHAFFALAGLAAYGFIVFLFKRSHRQEYLSVSATLFSICYVAGWFGARALSIVVEQFEVNGISEFVSQLFQFGPMTFYGGALLATAVGLIFVRTKGLPLGPICDVFVPAGVLALGIGRIGCYLNGDDFGKPVPISLGSPWWSSTFPNLADGIARYPVQLFEAGTSFLIAALSAFLYLKSSKIRENRSGFCAFLAIVVSATSRFIIEFFRGDIRGNFFSTSLSTSQGIALLLIFISGTGFLVLMKSNPES